MVVQGGANPLIKRFFHSRSRGGRRPRINKPPPFAGLNIRIPIIIPITGWGLINYGSTLGFRVRARSWFAHQVTRVEGLGFIVPP